MDSTGVFKLPLPVDNAEPTPSTSPKEETALSSCQNCKKLVVYSRKRSAAFQNVVKGLRTDYTKLHEYASNLEEELRKEKSFRGKVQQKYREQLAKSAMLTEELARVTGTLKKTAECATQTDQSSLNSVIESTNQSMPSHTSFSFSPVPSPASSPGSLSVNASDSGFSEKSASPNLPKVPTAEPKKRRRPAKKPVEIPSTKSPLPNDGLPPPKSKRRKATPNPKQPPQKEAPVLSESSLDTMAMDIDQLLGFDDVTLSVPVVQPEPTPSTVAQVDVALPASSLVPSSDILPSYVSLSPPVLTVTNKRKRPPPKKVSSVETPPSAFTSPTEAILPQMPLPKRVSVSRRKKQPVGSSINRETGGDSGDGAVIEKPKKVAKPRKPRTTKKKVEPQRNEVQLKNEVSNREVTTEDGRSSVETKELFQMISEFSFDQRILSPASPLRPDESLQETENSMSSSDIESLLRDIHTEFDVDPLVNLANLEEVSQMELPELSVYL
ncbi:hypothetical protein RvY_08122 [Ramazzottius varieornatus]|uniref:Uncharacterized protein n=1 Tax=Ramazzottius varieornatus TaxID=947166 RepID=A0A1D1VAG3_RAMVA|nr:hypothetical protein RvY_08122 [Ramazzottius varieornatus]